MAVGVFPSLLIIALISLFFLIGNLITVVVEILKKFPKLYQQKLLLTAGLAHKLRNYRTSLFSTTLLTGFSVFFIGLAISQFATLQISVAMFLPFDFMLEQRADYQNLTMQEVKTLVENVGGKIDQIKKLPYLDFRLFGQLEQEYYLEFFITGRAFLVNERDFSNFVDQEITVKPHELLTVINRQVADEALVGATTGSHLFILEPQTIRPDSTKLTREEILLEAREHPVFVVEAENTRVMRLPTINSRGIANFTRNELQVINDAVWQELAADLTVLQNNAFLAFNLASGDHEAVLTALTRELEKRNELAIGTLAEPEPADELHWRMRPISQAERFELALGAGSFTLFTFVLLGVLFLASAFIVLYHKFVADLSEEQETLNQFRRIGLTTKECRKYISTHLAIVFFLPILVGGIAGLFLVAQLAVFQTIATKQMWATFSKVLLMYKIIVLFVTMLYFLLRRKFLKITKI